jgi:hypothetical protein
MNGKWRGVSLVAAVFLAVVLCGARAEEEKSTKKEYKAGDFPAQTFELKEKGKKHFHVAFPEGKAFSVTVKSKKESDVNLFIYDADKKEVAKDDSPGPSCDLTFTAKKEGVYTVEVVNKGPGANTSTLKIASAKKKK